MFHQERARARQRDELIQTLIDENTSLRERPAPRNEVSHDPKVPLPSEFTGKVSEFRNFMAQCTLTFAMCPNTYAKGYQKVLFVIALLRGTPLDWARSIAENANHPFYNDYDAFKNALSNIYLDRNVNAASRDKLSTLQQTGSAAAYAVEFQSLTANLELGDAALCLLFYEKLKPTVKDALALVGQATTFYALVDQAICIDQRQFQRKKEEKKNNLLSKPTTSNSRFTTPRTTSNFTIPRPMPRTPHPPENWQSQTPSRSES